MEQLLAPAKINYLLEAPLEILHEESMEWLEEIEFWKDEVAFFYKLIIRKADKKPRPKTKTMLGIESKLIYLSSEKLDDLKLEIQIHERFLARMMKSVKQDEGAYRAKHKIIAKKVQDFEMEMKEIKSKVFALVKKSTRKLILK